MGAVERLAAKRARISPAIHSVNRKSQIAMMRQLLILFLSTSSLAAAEVSQKSGHVVRNSTRTKTRFLKIPPEVHSG